MRNSSPFASSGSSPEPLQRQRQCCWVPAVFRQAKGKNENPDISQRTGDEAKGGEWEFGIWGTWEVRKIVLKSLKDAALWSRLVSVDDPGEQVKRKREEGNIMVYM